MAIDLRTKLLALQAEAEYASEIVSVKRSVVNLIALLLEEVAPKTTGGAGARCAYCGGAADRFIKECYTCPDCAIAAPR